MWINRKVVIPRFQNQFCFYLNLITSSDRKSLKIFTPDFLTSKTHICNKTI
jgi:hypothetical protein